MGSAQQITLGLICLVAAFAFGNYVNNHPAGKNPLAENAAGELVPGQAPGSTGHSGNIQSRLAPEQFNPVEQRPAPIATMRTPIKPRFGLPSPSVSADANSTLQRANDQRPNDTQDTHLPPPSELARKSQRTNNGAKTLRDQQLTVVPDFSQIAAEFKNTPIELPNLGEMPAVTNQPTQKPGFQFPDRNEVSKELFVRQQPPTTNQPLLPDNRFDNESQVTHVTPSPNVTSANPSWFSIEDFVPKLNSGPAVTNDVGIQPLVQRAEPQLEPRASYAAPPSPDIDDSTSQRAELNWNSNPGLKYSQNATGKSVMRPKADNRVNSRAQIGGIDYDVPPPFPDSSYENGNQRPKFAGSFDHQQQQRSPNNANPNRVRTLLPNTELRNRNTSQLQNASQLSQLTKSNSRVGLNTSRFLNHKLTTGESLQSVSTRYFGRPEFYLDIYLANRSQMRHPGDVRPGMTLRIPIYE